MLLTLFVPPDVWCVRCFYIFCHLLYMYFAYDFIMNNNNNKDLLAACWADRFLVVLPHMAAGHSRALKPVTRTCTMSVSGAKTGAERAEKIRWSCERTWQKRWSGSRARSGRSQSWNRTESGLNRLPTARSNLTFHWLVFITYIVCTLLNAVCSSVFSLYSSLALSLSQTRLATSLFFNLTQPKARPHPSCCRHKGF